MKRILILLATTTLLSASTTTLIAQGPDASTPEPVCISSPRQCLDLTLNSYLKALLIHKPEALPVASNLKFTENGVERKLGEGLWQTITGFNVAGGGTKQEFIDVPKGTAGLHMIALEGTTQAVFILRIKVVDRKITEVETHVFRNQPGGVTFDIGGLHGVMNAVPKPAQLNSRTETTRITERYIEALKTGSFGTVETALAPNAYRKENGRITAGPGCTVAPGCENILTAQIPAQPMQSYRIEAVDEDLGLVWTREDFGSHVAWEGIKIYDGQIRAIEGFAGR